MGRVLGALLLLIVIAGGVIVFRILNAAGYFNEVTPHFAGKCQTIEGVVGAEDIEADREEPRRAAPTQPQSTAALQGLVEPLGVFAALREASYFETSPAHGAQTG